MAREWRQRGRQVSFGDRERRSGHGSRAMLDILGQFVVLERFLWFDEAEWPSTYGASV
jgi:hypothetical protein